jgi:hypothetical protein
MQEYDKHPLLKAVPGHLLQFEEKIFGMTLTQLLSDLGAAVGILALTTSMPLVPRIVVGVLLMIGVLILVHAKVGSYTMLYWLYLLGRSRLLPTRTIFRSPSEEIQKGEPGSVQESWIRLNTLERGAAGVLTPRKNRKQPDANYWVVFEVQSLQNVRFLAEAEQVRIYERFKLFLDGLNFPMKFISLVETADAERDPALVAQRDVISALETSPHLQRLQKESLKYQQGTLQHCTTTRHFVVVSASTSELVRLRADGTARSPLLRLFELLRPSKQPEITPAQVKNELSIRVSIVKKALQHLDVQATLLDDTQVLQAYASCLALGTHVPSFEVEILQGEGDNGSSIPSDQDEPFEPLTTRIPARDGRVTAENGQTFTERQASGKAASIPLWKKCIKGLHRSFVYKSANKQARIEQEAVRLADLVAPSEVTLLKDAVEVTVHGEKRYQRYYEVIGFAPELLCGWQEELTTLALPMIVTTQCQPIDSRFMINKLELHLTKLESQKLADQKALRQTKIDQKVEAEQVRAVIDALARKKLKIFTVQMVIGIHASDPGRLEQRANYLLSHLRDMQLRVRALSRRHDRGWQACLPADLAWLDTSTNLPSDVLSTFMNWSTGRVGTATGAYIGTTGSGFSRRPVYFNPWDEKKRLPNPHVVICGESGMGKSWLAKTLIMGLLSAKIADAVVLDRDGDYDAIHEYLRGESQRFNLAGACPINLLDIPYGPADVNLDDPIDLMAEFIDNHLLIGLALLYGETLTKSQEAFLTHAAREAYAAKGITIEAIRRDPQTLLHEPPVFANLIAAMKNVPASSETMRQALVERFENVAYLFPGQTTVQIHCPLTIFNINKLDEKWYPLMIYVVQNFLQRHRSIRRDDRYLAYVVEEASYMLRHPAGKRYLESGSRGFRKLGIAQFTLSQHPADFLEEGQVIISNAGTCFFLGMQRHAAQKLKLAEELERVLEEGVSGQAIVRCGREYAAIEVAKQSPLHRAIFTTDPGERRRLQERKQKRKTRAQSQQQAAS